MQEEGDLLTYKAGRSFSDLKEVASEYTSPIDGAEHHNISIQL